MPIAIESIELSQNPPPKKPKKHFPSITIALCRKKASICIPIESHRMVPFALWVHPLSSLEFDIVSTMLSASSALHLTRNKKDCTDAANIPAERQLKQSWLEFCN